MAVALRLRRINANQKRHLTTLLCVYTNNVMNEKLKTTVEEVACNCLAVRTRILGRVVSQIYDEALRSHALKVSQLNILVVAARLGRATHAEVCETLRLDASTLSRNVKRLIASGWLEACESQDRRFQPFQLTSTGTKRLSNALEAWRAAQVKAEKLLGKSGVSFLSEFESVLETNDL